ncbi:hypothetical protein [Nostoc sp.]|uniref:hypothetical protein n=1 Tax=Nostoc sp. TaxID=1180 RepID=UPI002FFB9FEA
MRIYYPELRLAIAFGAVVVELLLTDSVLETDGARDFYPTDNRKSFTVMIVGNKIIIGKNR